MSIAAYPPRELVTSGSILGRAVQEGGQIPLNAGAYDVPGLSIPVWVGTNRVLRISTFLCMAGGTITESKILRDGGQLNRYYDNRGGLCTHDWHVIDTDPTPGQRTYSVRTVNQAAGTLYADAGNECWIMVEDITGGAAGPGPITLGYKENFGHGTVIGTSDTDIPGSEVTVNVPAGRRLRIRGRSHFSTGTVSMRAALKIWEGTTDINGHWWPILANVAGQDMSVEAYVNPTPGAHTYRLRAVTGAASTFNVYTTATIFNQMVVEDVTGTEAPTGAYYEANWTNVSAFTNGWANYDPANYTVASYRKVNDLVYLRGLIRNGTLSTPAFNLPVGYRPTLDHHFACLGGSALLGVRIFRDGRVTPGDPGVNTWCALDGIVFGTT